MISNKDELLDLLRELSLTLDEIEVITFDQCNAYFDRIDIGSDHWCDRVEGGFPYAKARHRALGSAVAQALNLMSDFLIEFKKGEVQS